MHCVVDRGAIASNLQANLNLSAYLIHAAADAWRSIDWPSGSVTIVEYRLTPSFPLNHPPLEAALFSRGVTADRAVSLTSLPLERRRRTVKASVAEMSWLVHFLHSFPHLRFTFEPVGAEFQPEDGKYREVSICCERFAKTSDSPSRLVPAGSSSQLRLVHEEIPLRCYLYGTMAPWPSGLEPWLSASRSGVRLR